MSPTQPKAPPRNKNGGGPHVTATHTRPASPWTPSPALQKRPEKPQHPHAPSSSSASRRAAATRHQSPPPPTPASSRSNSPRIERAPPTGIFLDPSPPRRTSISGAWGASMSMAFSCAGARLQGRVGMGKCRGGGGGGAAMVRRSGCYLYPSGRRGLGVRGIRAELPPRACADGGGATTSGSTVVVPEAGQVADHAKEVGAVASPGVLPAEERGEVADVDGSGGNGKLPSGGGGGDGDNGGGGGGGGGDGGDEGDDEFGPILSFDQVVQEVEKRGVSLPSLPADMIEAAKSVGIQKLLLLRYLDMQASAWPLGPAIRSCSLLRNRMLVDPSFLFKIGTEIVIDTCCATFAEVQKRGEEFWSEFELYAADMLVGVVVNVALVGMLAPYARFGGGSASPGLLGRVRHAYDSLPSSVFEAERPGYSFSVQQRIGTYFFKGILYGTVGFFCGLVGQGIANLIMTAKRSVKKSDDDVPVPPLLKTSALWGAFLGVSSNTRYQIINGLERVVEASPVAKRVPAVSLAFTVGVRFANNIYGGMQFVDWARMTGCQ
uniref:Uncharacterized protein n=1 Tax=Oryza punctata TaxID=4537 RepID=A0A0E0LIT9_ORYPU